MKEDILCAIWAHKAFDFSNLKTTCGKRVVIVDGGQKNGNSGPDFTGAVLIIDGARVYGDVEMHTTASNWYAHHHERDANYTNVVLHVVWESDVEVFTVNSKPIPTLELKNLINANVKSRYHSLFSGTQKFINCEKLFATVPKNVTTRWLELVYYTRLEKKTTSILELLKTSNNDRELAFFKLLLRNFGLNINGQSFWDIANSFDFSVFRKCQNNLQREALLFGQAHLLEDEYPDSYFLHLKSEYSYLSKKFELQKLPKTVAFFKLRPPNFPTIRLSQFSSLYEAHSSLLSNVLDCSSIGDLYRLFRVKPSVYWQTHYSFGKESKESTKYTTTDFIDLLIINTIVPFFYCFKIQGGKEKSAFILSLLERIKPEKNNIFKAYESLGFIAENALQSQALKELHQTFCVKDNCAKCGLGQHVLYQGSATSV